MKTLSLCLAVLLSALSASAAQISFDSLSSPQGFVFRTDVHDGFGVITSLKIGSTVLKADIATTEIVNKAAQKATVAGVLSSVQWSGGSSDAIAIKGFLTTANRNIVFGMLQKSLTDTKVEIEFEVYQYDAESKTWYAALMPKGGVVLKGNIAKEGKDKLLLSLVGNTPSTLVKSPQNWELDLTIMPQPIAQTLQYNTSSNVSVLKAWGTTVK